MVCIFNKEGGFDKHIKTILEWDITGKRPKGYSNKRWPNVITQCQEILLIVI